MDDVFEALIGSYIENRIGIVSNFLTNGLANKLKDSLVLLNKNSLLLAIFGNYLKFYRTLNAYAIKTNNLSSKTHSVNF
jgi:hypothetical protein